jgi:SAM-dependent methyltransferase
VGAQGALMQGREAARRLEWVDAYTALSLADSSSPLAAQDLELLATAALLLGHVEDGLGALQRAHQRYSEGGDPRRAARCAFWLTFHLGARGDVAQASGWFGRASRLLEHEQECAEHGYLLISVAFHQLVAGDYAAGGLPRHKQPRSAVAPVTPTWSPSRGTCRAAPSSTTARWMRVLLDADSPLHELASTWLPAVPNLDRRLRAAPPARVLDLGCGLGASSIALARAYPNARVLGVDLDEASVTEARAAAAEVGVAHLVTFVVGDAARVASEAPFELVTIFEALHDMGDPVGALRAARALLAADGTVLVADERVAETLTAPGDQVERFMYGWSVLHCLPATLAERPVEATGTVLRAPTVARWAAAAGFTGFEVLPIDNPFWRFYRLHS